MSNSLYASAEYSTALAVVGMAGRFSGSQSLEGFWQNIATKASTIRHYTEAELLAAGVKPEDLQQPNYVKAGSVLENIEYFDTSFFGFNPREAEVLDPQFRIFLECVWEVLEMAGYDLTTYDGLVGVFAGAGYKNYLLHHIQKTPAISEAMSEFQISLSQEADVLAALTSYKLNLKGPSVSVQSFCSTSLLGVHLAGQSLLNYECDIAVAGGVALNSLQMKGYFYEEGRIVSPDGFCRPFDARAQGTVLGNGAAVVALKRLQEALADGDQIYSIIRGSATNNDGNQRVSFTSPGLNGQASVIVSAMSYAGVHPETIAYIEANGTGTKLGDAIEMAAMIKAFSGKTQKKQFCAIGSLKPNVGHLDRASGVAGLIKTTLALRHHQFPPHLHYEQPNPEVDLANSPFYVNTELLPWPHQQTPRRAGINSFGLGGTNVHLVIEEAPELESSNSLRTWHIFPISARTEWSLQQARSNLAAHLGSHTDQACADIAYTLQVGRSSFSYRNFVVAQTLEEARVALENQAGQFTHQEHRDRPVALLLPDTDAQYRDLARSAYAQEPLFREIVARHLQSLPAELKGELQGLLLPKPETRPVAERDGTEQCELSPSALLVVQYVLAQLLLEWGIQPQALLGHGPGEYVAACLAGIFTLENALALVTYHAQLAARPETMGKASLNALRTINLQSPRIPLVSSVTGTWITPAQATDLDYWLQRTGQHASPDQGVTLLLQDPELVLLEMGTAGNLVQPHDNAEQQHQICSLTGPDNEQPAISAVLGRLWLAGVTIDWKRLSRGERRLRVPLPTYPFERQRCWIDDPANLNAIRQRVAATKKEADIANWFYLPYWQQTFPLVLPEATTRQQTENAFLLFMDTVGIGAQVAASLEQAGYLVITVEAGQSFAQCGNKHFSLRPGADEDYAALFTALGKLELRPRTILHCWNVTVDEQLKTGFTSLLSLARAIG
ncbi:MAG TPA: type I polyketide synthase, partial [Ktedonobacteraceae bacterium]|nr:type I polyketide synthase [Ktedonobacteraceae bacterium]